MSSIFLKNFWSPYSLGIRFRKILIHLLKNQDFPGRLKYWRNNDNFCTFLDHWEQGKFFEGGGRVVFEIVLYGMENLGGGFRIFSQKTLVNWRNFLIEEGGGGVTPNTPLATSLIESKKLEDLEFFWDTDIFWEKIERLSRWKQWR